MQKSISARTIISLVFWKVSIEIGPKVGEEYPLGTHDVRAFAASKAFQSGVSLDQILAACHWKSHNTFTQFYLKDVAWADSELFHLGPVVAAQQIHQ